MGSADTGAREPQAHVVCRECGARWEAATQPRECINPECDATWLALSQFADKADADRAAADFAREAAAASSPEEADLVSALTRAVETLMAGIDLAIGAHEELRMDTPLDENTRLSVLATLLRSKRQASELVYDALAAGVGVPPDEQSVAQSAESADVRGGPRTFTMYRRGDLSATHDANQANAPDEPQFEGVVFSDGRCALRWLTPKASVSVWDSLDDALAIHGHPEYDSELVWHALAGVGEARPADDDYFKPYGEVVHELTEANRECDQLRERVAELEFSYRGAHLAFLHAEKRADEAEALVSALRGDARVLDLKKFSAWLFFSGFVIGFVFDAVTRWVG